MMPHSVRAQAGLYSIDYWVPLGIVLFSEQKRRTHVFARSHRLVWPLPGIPLRGEGGSCVPRKRKTDEGCLPLPMGEVPRRGGEGMFTLSVTP